MRTADVIVHEPRAERQLPQSRRQTQLLEQASCQREAAQHGEGIEPQHCAAHLRRILRSCTYDCLNMTIQIRCKVHPARWNEHAATDPIELYRSSG